jgi:Tol biopolymer transport system component
MLRGMPSGSPPWRDIEQLYHAALECDTAGRAMLLARADPDVRREVASLLAQRTDDAGLSNPAPFIAAALRGADRSESPEVRIPAGTRLGPYEISAQIGAGGMGEVYRARDTRLGRDVAIKILPSVFRNDPERVARFQREARALASLNHPHIGAIYGVEEADDVTALVMELVDGDDLSQRIASARMPLHEVLAIARQISEALEAAHAQGIIHRDLKPANIKIGRDGAVKVLDFGLAKLAPSSESATLTATQAGAIMGTPAYMSPEQARGEEAGPQTDIWSFGVVLYELLAGLSPFSRGTVTETLASVLGTQPDYSLLPLDTPANVRHLVRRCLEKDRKRRLQHIGDARIDLEDALAALTGGATFGPAGAFAPDALASPPASATASRRRERAVWITLLSLTAAIAITLGWAFRPIERPPQTHLEIVTPPSRDPASFALSPDGRTIVFEATGDDGSRLWLRSLDSATARPLAGTENASLPFWSPDNRSIGFFADSKLKRLDVDTGSIQLLASATLTPVGGTWNSDRTILFAPNVQGGVFRVQDTGGDAALVGPGMVPQLLPDGRRFLSSVVGSPSGVERPGLYLNNIDGSESIPVFDGGGRWAWVMAPGQLLYLRTGTLYAQAFDERRLALTGQAIRVAERVLTPGGYVPAVSVSTAGAIAYRSGSAPWTRRQLIWFNRSGVELGRVGDGGGQGASLSPDGRFVALSRSVDGNNDVWLLNTATGVLSPFTSHPAGDQSPVWSPDGRRVVFASIRRGIVDLYVKSMAGGDEEVLLETSANKSPSDWSLDGRHLLYRSNDRETGFDIWALPMQGNAEEFSVLQTEFQERDGQFSPDAKWIAYESNRSGRPEIYVYPFPGPGLQQQVSAGGGAQVRWRSDGRELFYVALDGFLMAVPVDRPNADTIDTGTPVRLFQTHVRDVLQPALTQQYVASADGQRFLVSTVRQEPTSSISVILNWRPPVD